MRSEFNLWCVKLLLCIYDIEIFSICIPSHFLICNWCRRSYIPSIKYCKFVFIMTVMVKFVRPSDITSTFSRQSGKICVISRPDVQFLLDAPQQEIPVYRWRPNQGKFKLHQRNDFGLADNCSVQQILLGCRTKCLTGWKKILPGL